MNCKPGDLAVVVGTLPLGAFLLGRIVEVLYAAEAADGSPSWVVRFPHEVTHPLTGLRSRETFAFDRNLRPIRDPGDDAVDETLRRVEEDAHA